MALSKFSVASSFSSRFLLSPKPSPPVKHNISYSTPSLFLNFPFSPLSLNNPAWKLWCSAVQEATAEVIPVPSQKPNLRRKLYVLNLPLSLTVADIKNLFGECGTVKDVELVKQKDGKGRGFAFLTMSSGEEAQAVVEKFDSHEVSGRIIRVEFAKRFKKPSPPRFPKGPDGQTRHKLSVSNLAWKVRSNNLREFFSPDYNPVSCGVVFESGTGSSAGYGFVSFATKEEAEAAISALNGKELMGRPLRLKFSETDVDESSSKTKEEELSESQTSEL